MRHIDAADVHAKGGSAAGRDGLTYVHADAHEFVLHMETDVMAVDECPAVNVPGADGLRMADVRAALGEFAKHKNLLGLVVAQYNPDRDPDGSGAKILVDLLVEALSARVEAPTAATAEPAESDTLSASSPETTA